jgi:SPP1 gp7 family putative phage head morphogenesis protein
MFITSSELEQIKKLTAEFSQVFWRRVAVVLHQKDVIKSARFSPRSSLTLSSLVTSLAVKIVTKSIALATLTKVNALKTATRSQQDSSEIATTTTATTRSAAADGSADPSSLEVLQWKTMEDAKVCPFCAQLDGTQWASDDPSLLTPPDDSHSNCRCRLDIVTGETGQFSNLG